MLGKMIISGIMRDSQHIRVDQSRCLPLRNRAFECSRCRSCCGVNAVRIDKEGLSIVENLCSECMLCVSECPSGCFEEEGADFLSDVEKLNGIPDPVLACNRMPNLKAHVRSSCLGLLSEEHLVVLATSLEQGIQLNLTECEKCCNGFIVGHLRKRIHDIDTKISLAAAEKVKLVENRESLEYRDVSYNRRDFFKALTGVSVQGAQRLLFQEYTGQKGRAYSEKKLPVRQKLLNLILSSSTNADALGILEGFYYEITTKESCDHCFCCVAACPTGALQPRHTESGKILLFNTSLCNGCGLCAMFCRKGALTISRGFHGAYPFDFMPCNGASGETVSHEAELSSSDHK